MPKPLALGREMGSRTRLFSSIYFQSCVAYHRNDSCVCVHAVVTFRMLRPTRHIKAGTLLTQLKKTRGESGSMADGEEFALDISLSV